MKISATKRFFLLSVCAVAIYFALIFSAHAQEVRTEPLARDPSLPRERSTYQYFHLQDRFGLYLDDYSPVCGSAAGEKEVHCNARVVTNASGTPMAWRTFMPDGYSPYQLLKAYGLTGRVNAARPPVIAIVVAYDTPFIVNDLSAYSSGMGIPGLPTCRQSISSSRTPCFAKVNQDGLGYPYPQRNEAWALEASMDVETAHAICQNCSILLVEASSPYLEDMTAAVDRAVTLGATVVSNSYGAFEFVEETNYDPHFHKPGVAFTASSGDSGYGVEYPAASPYVTAVGGTTLLLNKDGSYNSEIVWSGSGSGCSVYEPRKEWQRDPACNNRYVADVSAVADPNTGAAIYDSFGYGGQRGWFKLGGTSLAAPIIAGVYALSGNLGATSTPPNSIPYTLGNSSNLHDITEGNNGECGGSLLCTARSGYDGPTGLGTPKGTGAF